MRYLLIILMALLSVTFRSNYAASGDNPSGSLPSDYMSSDTEAGNDESDDITEDSAPEESMPEDSVPVEVGPGGVPVHPEWPHTMASRSIPLMHIVTDSLRPILDKINYLDAVASVEVPFGQNTWEALGSPEDPVPLEIRGRGNFTWFHTEKKSYKLKFKKKTSVLGMPANKHYALICYDMFYTSGWLAPYVGMEVCRMVQPRWVPRMMPVEVVLNGEYRGIYLLVESIKIADDRLDIEVQDEEETDAAIIAQGGWLVELDNQDDEFQVTVPCDNKHGYLRVTHKEPEVISEAQREWLIDEFTYLSQLIDHPGLYPYDSWTDHIDVSSVARYMLIRELLHDIDGYSGSQYFHRSVGAEKWEAGPMWDLEIWPEKKPGWIRDYPRWAMLNWIPNMMRSPKLSHEFERQWREFYPARMEELIHFIEEASWTYASADASNGLRWPSERRPVSESALQLCEDLSYNASWINLNPNWSPIVATERVAEDGSGDRYAGEIKVSCGAVLVTAAESGAVLKVLTPDGMTLSTMKLDVGQNRFRTDELAGRRGSFVLLMESPAYRPVFRHIIL